MKNTAFTLIELMLVIVIISILSTLALPSYRHYLERTRFAEVLLATEPFKLAVALALQLGEPLSTLKNGSAQIPKAPDPTDNLASLHVTHGHILAKATSKAGGYTLELTPDSTGTHWQASGTCKTAGVC